MSIITEIKKFNRKYTIITHMQDSALPADSEVLLEGVVIVYTPTGELKDAEKCKVGDGVTEFCNLPWLGGEEVVLEDLTTELQRQDELLTEIETFITSINGTEPEASEAYWYFVYNQHSAILTIKDGHVCSVADPWYWAIEGNATDYAFDTSPTKTYPLRLLDKTKTYTCINGTEGGLSSEPYYAKVTYGRPPKMWLLEYTGDGVESSSNVWGWPWIYQNCIYTHQEDLTMQLSSPNEESRSIGYGFSLDELDPTIEYNVMLFDGYDSTGVLRFGYPVNNDFDPNYSESGTEVSGVVVEFPTEFSEGQGYPTNSVLRLSVGADTRLDDDQITVEFFDREDSTLGTQTFTVYSDTSVEFDFEGFGGESFIANGEHRIVVTYRIDSELFTEEYSANWP